jgi:hypothetical protein
MPSPDHARTYANVVGTCQEIDAGLTHAGFRSVRYELIDKDGNVYGPYASAYHAGLAAKAAWPDQAQDEERTGKGWDVQAVIPNLS